MPLSSAKCFSFHNTVLILQVSPDPVPSSSLPSSGLCNLPLVPGSVTSALCIPEAAIPSPPPPPPHPPPLHPPPPSPPYSYFCPLFPLPILHSPLLSPPPILLLHLPLLLLWLELLETSHALARLESDSSSAPAEFPECSWVAVKDFRLSGMGRVGQSTEEEAPSTSTLLPNPHPGRGGGRGGGDCALSVPGSSGCVSDFVNMFRRKPVGVELACGWPAGVQKLALLGSPPTAFHPAETEPLQR